MYVEKITSFVVHSSSIKNTCSLIPVMVRKRKMKSKVCFLMRNETGIDVLLP